MSFKIVSLTLFVLGGLAAVQGHGTEVRWCLLPDKTIRIFVEHWHGDLGSPSSAGTMSIRDGLTNQLLTLAPDGVINNQSPTNIAVAGGCDGGTATLVTDCRATYNDWVYYDFAPTSCGAGGAQSYIFEAGNTVVLTEGCSGLYPASISTTEGFECVDTCTYEWASVENGCCRFSENDDVEGSPVEITYGQYPDRRRCRQACKGLTGCLAYEWSDEYQVCELFNQTSDSLETSSPARCQQSKCHTRTCAGVDPFAVQGNPTDSEYNSSTSVIIPVITVVVLVVAALAVGVRMWATKRVEKEDPTTIVFDPDALPQAIVL